MFWSYFVDCFFVIPTPESTTFWLRNLKKELKMVVAEGGRT